MGNVPQVMEDAIALICRNLAVTKIVAVTISGYAARMLSARRPNQPIIAVSNDRMAARSFNLLAGVEGVFVDMKFPRDSVDHVAACLEHLWDTGKLDEDDLVLVTAVGFPRSGNRMNLIQTHHVADLITALEWKARSA
jgi:pyruvate kinase